MSQFLYGSICLEDVFGNLIQRGQDGSAWINLSALPHPFVTGQKNGKHYVPVNLWINDQVDQYGNSASISIGQSKEEREQQIKRTYIGNMKQNTPTQQYAPQSAPVATTPFGQPPVQAAPQGYAAPQNPQAAQQYYPQQPAQAAPAPGGFSPATQAAPAAQYAPQGYAPQGSLATGPAAPGYGPAAPAVNDDLPF
ncbi:hypothetical protein SAMN05192529_13151 [Arachidicoccus rhizosphaerae]|uniref:Uncharacterized protein n=1 Tax=Arachidicoccus rhizosphaerae TaxID=551991 RepID=A0A1H4CGX9_9BACT|nr:hypothetical protein [Arachidicoccus rhizosphaerae]SEA59627.1 hypothetical protein SAMN05192529_13151 [Arachidicoccus rhizosphaerae]